MTRKAITAIFAIAAAVAAIVPVRAVAQGMTRLTTVSDEIVTSEFSARKIKNHVVRRHTHRAHVSANLRHRVRSRRVTVHHHAKSRHIAGIHKVPKSGNAAGTHAKLGHWSGKQGAEPNPLGPGPGKRRIGPITLGPGPGINIVPSAIPPGISQPPQTTRRARSAPPANGQRMVPDEVIVELAATASPRVFDQFLRRHRLVRIESQAFELPATTLYRMRIPDRRPVASVVRALEADPVVVGAQPNFLFALQEAPDLRDSNASHETKAVQYALAKMRLPEAHDVARGDGVLVAVIDSGIDSSHEELSGAIAETFDSLKPPFKPHAHGTAVASLICGHARLMGSAPAANILAARAFDSTGSSADATTFNVLRSLDWAAARGARVINMSFAGSFDPAVHRSLEAAHKKGIVLVAAAGNAGPKSAPLYPAADANVIAVAATDAEDNAFPKSNHGEYIAVAAPGVGILAAAPGGAYQVADGTSYSAAEVSGIVALMLQRSPGLTPAAIRDLLMATAKHFALDGQHELFGSGLVDAYRAVTESVPASLSGR